MTEAQTRPESSETLGAEADVPVLAPATDAAPEAPPAATAPTVENALPEDRYLNRELSWLDFNARVLALSADPSLPLLERAKFLAIFASNLDEFYMVRVAGLKRRDEMGLSVRSADGLSPREQLRRISERTQQIASRHAHVFLDAVRPALADEGIVIVTWAELDDAERGKLSTYFHEQVFPVLTPLAVDPAHPFPFVSGLSLNLAITVKHPRRRSALRANQGARQRRPVRRAAGPRRQLGRGAVPADGGTDRRVPSGVVPRPGGRRAPRLPDHPQRRLRGGGGPRRGPAAGAGAGTGPSPVRLPGAAGGLR